MLIHDLEHNEEVGSGESGESGESWLTSVILGFVLCPFYWDQCFATAFCFIVDSLINSFTHDDVLTYDSEQHTNSDFFLLQNLTEY